MMAARFSGQVALIAGGTGGLGRAVSLAFLNEGAKVVVTYRDEKELAELTRAAEGSSLKGERVDVTDVSAVDELVRGVVAEHGRIDVLVNAVGAYAGGTKFWESDPKTFDLMLALNVRSGYVLSRAIVPVMLKQERGAIVNIASKAAVDHAGGAAAYVASKACWWRSVACHSASMKTGLIASISWRALFQKSSGTNPATSQR